MDALGSLESTQEARVALGYRLEPLLRFFRALQTSPRASITRYTHAKHEPILKYYITKVNLAKFQSFLLHHAYSSTSLICSVQIYLASVCSG